MKHKLILLLGVILLAVSPLTHADQMAYSQSPPGGLAPEQCPMFVCFGFDDNGYADGLQWVRELFQNKRNPDGSPARATFFLTSKYGEDFPEVADEWKALYEDGHEIGNHTRTHSEALRAYNEQQWADELSQANNFFTQNVGVNGNEILGFRTPFLAYTPATMSALVSLGFKYDCSIEFGYNGWEPSPGDPDYPPESSGVWYNSMGDPRTHQKLFWPYTLDEGSPPGHSAVGNPTIAGLWEIPVYTYLRPENTGVITGFDFNLWTSATQQYFTETLKHNFDLRRTGNRNPLSVNGHSDYYSEDNEPYVSPSFQNSTWQTRRAAIADFLNYVLQFSETRVRPMKDMIAWMKNPTPIGPTPIASEQKPSRTVLSFSLKNATTTMIEFTTPSHGAYTLSILDMQGRTITKISHFFHKENNYRYVFTTPLPVGAYMVRMSNGKNSAVRKVVLVQ